MFTVGTGSTASRELLVALNNGKFPRASTEPDKKKLNFQWKLPRKQSKLPFTTIDGVKNPSKAQIAKIKLFGLISQIVYPYWSYNIKHKVSGSLIIEASDCKSISSIININTGKLLKNPNKIRVAFLDNNKLQIFLQNIHQKNPAKTSIIASTLNRTNSMNIENEMSVIFVLGNPIFTMKANKNKKLNGSFDAECNKFTKLLQKTGLKKCDYLEIDIRKNQIFARSLNIIISDPDWMESIKKPHTNYPTFEVFSALNNNGYPSKCDFNGKCLSELKWEKPWESFVDALLSHLASNSKPRHYRMVRLYVEISHLLYPYWAYNTKHKGMGLIVVRGQRMYNALHNFVDQTGDLIDNNSMKLEATFLDIKQLKLYLSHFDLDPDKAGKPEMEAAALCYQHKESIIGVLFGFQDVMSMCLRGIKSPQSKDYQYEAVEFENMMKRLDMKTCEYLEIDLNQRNVSGFSMCSIYDNRNIVKPDDDEKKMNINDVPVNNKKCGYCKAVKSKLQRCSRCNNMWYCDAKCQRPHWRIHKLHCIPANVAKQ